MAENMTTNAKYIYSFFRNKGWTNNSICGMLGNMQGESGIIADLNEAGGGGGYGLVQWTPKSNLTTWANKNGLDYRTVDTQCKRLQWELENGQQFYSTSAYPMNFKKFTQSTESPTYLAKVFINNYERPANPNQPKRGVWAENWYSVLVGGPTPPSPTASSLSQLQHLFNVQLNAGLTEDGIYGPNTQAAADKCIIRSGSSGEITRWIQKKLISLGYPLPKYGADGSYGSEMQNALTNFQKAHGLSTDGVVGHSTWKALMTS